MYKLIKDDDIKKDGISIKRERVGVCVKVFDMGIKVCCVFGRGL